MSKIKLISILSILFVFTGCFYDYGVRSDCDEFKYNLEDQHFYIDENDTYEFVSPIYYDGVTSSPFVIHVEHLSKNRYGNYNSKIMIEDFFPSLNKTIILKSIKLVHSRKGKVIQEKNTHFRAIKTSYIDNEGKLNDIREEISVMPDEYNIEKGVSLYQKGESSFGAAGESRYYIEFSKEYDLKFKPGKIDEYIYLEIIVNGKTQILEYNFPLRYKKRNTLGGMLEAAMYL